MSTQPPFAFERIRNDLVDVANNLRLTVYQWPEYYYTVTLEPAEGAQAEAWPVRSRAFYEFHYRQWSEGTKTFQKFSYVVEHQPFEARFPGRRREVLEHVIALILPTSLENFPQLSPGVTPIIQPGMRCFIEGDGRSFSDLPK